MCLKEFQAFFAVVGKLPEHPDIDGFHVRDSRQVPYDVTKLEGHRQERIDTYHRTGRYGAWSQVERDPRDEDGHISRNEAYKENGLPALTRVMSINL